MTSSIKCDTNVISNVIRYVVQWWYSMVQYGDMVQCPSVHHADIQIYRYEQEITYVREIREVIAEGSTF